MEHKRELSRIAIQRKGQVRRGPEMALCEVVDLTEKGLQVRTDLPVHVGDVLQLEVNLTDGAFIQCTMEVMHQIGNQLGVRITEISPDHKRELAQFVEQVIALSLMGF